MTARMLQVTQLRVTVASVDPDAGVFTGRAATYGLPVDRGRDWDGLMLREGIRSGAFAAQLTDPARVKVLWQHDQADPIGHVTALKDSPDGLDFTARLDLDPLVPSAGRARLQMQSGTLTDLSVGFAWEKWTEDEDEDERTRTIWHERAQLREVSTVTWGAQGDAASASSVHRPGSELLVRRARIARATLARQRLH